jgi:GDP-mannose:di-myo-inositol-1,3'-phosphate beta-1,2-mannosyltransferase
MMTRWNVPSGQSSHAEPIGRAWLKMGHELKVFAPAGMDLSLIYQQDEPFVRRCYMQDIWGERDRSDYFFDPRPFLEDDYEIFLVEMAAIMPMPELLSIFPQIKRKAKTIHVVHETGLPQDPNWYKFDWDAIVCFDERYKQFLGKVFPEKKIAIISFPCHPLAHGDRKAARKLLGLPLDKKIVFAYGADSVYFHVELLPVMEKLSQEYPVLFLLLTHHTQTAVPELKSPPKYFMLRDEMPTDDRLYTYLHASDAYIYYGRVSIDGVGVSSCVTTCLGAGRPVLVPGYCNFFDLSGKEVIKYGDFDDLEQKLRAIFDGTESVRESLAAAKEYATGNSSARIAAQFIKLFEKIRERP